MSEIEELAKLEAEYQLGEAAESFISSDVGQHVVRCSIREIESFRDQLEKETDFTKIKQLQNEIMARRMAIYWLKTTIDEGFAAGQNIQVITSEDYNG